MEAFYKAQHFIESEEDWSAFLQSLRTTLPATFRICSDYAFTEDLKKDIHSFMGEHLNVDGVEIKAVESLGWYPNGNAYKLGTDRRSIRKLESLNTLHRWMITHTDNGNITRQEAVSMVPPLALDVAPHHKCLDMCASPGSKTSQLLEIVNKSLASPPEQQGLVVANDVDTDRAYMLVHQCKRINSPFLVITTHPGQAFPPLRGSADQYKSEFFDRVLCDVPCSGDGTLRKNPMIWGKWCTQMATSLHTLQLTIARRGLQLLKSDGLMVYSTCSMSPYEDEAVVAELLRWHKGELELIDARSFMPLFKARPGLENWYVLDDYHAAKKEAKAKKSFKNDQDLDASKVGDIDENKEQGGQMEIGEERTADESKHQEGVDEQTVPNEERKDFSHVTDPALRACLEMGMQYFPTFEDVPSHLDWKIKRSFFPPTAEEKEWMHLERCLRCVPQDEDSGGFFVAALRKVRKDDNSQRPVSSEAAEVIGNSEVDDVKASGVASMENSIVGSVPEPEKADGHNGKKGAKGKLSQRGLVEYLPWEDAAWEKIRAFYDFDERIGQDSFFVREDAVTKANKKGGTSSKTIYYMPQSVRSLLLGDEKKQLKVVTAGLKAFEKKTMANGESDYRLLQDSIQVLAPFIRARKIQVTAQDFSNILGGGLVSFSTLSASTIAQLCALPTGMVITYYDYDSNDCLPADEGSEFIPRLGNFRFYAVCWKGISKTMNVMCSKIGGCLDFSGFL